MAFKETKRKGFNFFRSYYDVFNELPDDDKLTFIKSLLDRQFLGTKPTDLKGMANFAYISQVNSIDSQVKGWEDKTGLKLTPTVGVEKILINPTEQVEGKGKEEEKGKVQVKEEKETKFVFRKALIDFGFEKELIEDWLLVRKTKKATNTKTAFDGFIKEVNKCPKETHNHILKTCIEKSWSGFKSGWLDKENNSQNSQNNKTQRTWTTNR